MYLRRRRDIFIHANMLMRDNIPHVPALLSDTHADSIVVPIGMWTGSGSANGAVSSQVDVALTALVMYIVSVPRVACCALHPRLSHVAPSALGRLFEGPDVNRNYINLQVSPARCPAGRRTGRCSWSCRGVRWPSRRRPRSSSSRGRGGRSGTSPASSFPAAALPCACRRRRC